MKALSQLRVISLFEDLSDAELARIAELCTIRSYEKGVQIAGQLDSSTDVFFVLDGGGKVPGLREIQRFCARLLFDLAGAGTGAARDSAPS